MTDFKDYHALQPKIITRLENESGYMHLIEYSLQDGSLLHVLQWHYKYDDIDTLLQNVHDETFYRSKNIALQKAYEIGKNILQINY